MARILYTILYYAITPFIFIRLKRRAKQAPAYSKRWGERLGYFPPPEKTGGFWVHAVSMGETIAIAPLVRKIQQAYPDLPVTITTMTPTGSAQVKALFGESVFHVYVPYDTPGAVQRFLDKVRPTLCLIVETELWPNLIHYSHQRQIPIIIANARLSEKSAKGYASLSRLTREMLNKIAVVAAQGSVDGERFVSLGLSRDKLEITGNVKFDLHVSDELRQKSAQLRSAWGEERPVWIAASTHDGEDELILDAFAQIRPQRPDLLLAIVPRHPERFDRVANLCRARNFTVARRSRNEPVNVDTDIMLGDTMGELLALYGASDVAFVGGTLVDTGGHNFLEPAAFGVPIVSGPSVFNFAQISAALIEAGALRLVQPEELAKNVAEMLGPNIHRGMREAALEVIDENRGAEQKLFDLVQRVIATTV
jgi:3-deoxy-D-manno-octulosonic-acid transferase